MANLITPPSSLIPGNRTIDAEVVISLVNAVNGLQAGTQSVAGVSSTGVVAGSYIHGSAATGLTAVGTNLATALALTSQVNQITTAAASTGVALPTIASVGIGTEITVFADGANAIKVYGAGSNTIDGTAGATGVTLTNTKRCKYVAVSATAWVSYQLGVVSA